MDPDVLLTLSSSRPNGSIMSAHKVSARRRRVIASPRTPRPLGPSTASHPQPHAPGRRAPATSVRSSPRSVEHFRSPRVLDEVSRLESKTTVTTLTTTTPAQGMQPEDAIKILQELLISSVDASECIVIRRLLSSLETACWKLPFSSVQPTAKDRKHHREGTICLGLRYAELYRVAVNNTVQIESAVKRLEQELAATMQRTDELPRMIRAKEQVLAQTITAFVALTATSLDVDDTTNKEPSRRKSSRHSRMPKREQSQRQSMRHHEADSMAKDDLEHWRTPSGQQRLAERVTERIATLHRRRDLRIWACNELRTAISDHATRASELKKAITAILSDVKREEVANLAKANRLETAIAQTGGEKSGKRVERSRESLGEYEQHATHRASSMHLHNQTHDRDRSDLLGTNTESVGDDPRAPYHSRISTRDRLIHAQEERVRLEDALALRREQVRRSTQGIFDIRNETHEVERRLAEVEAQCESCDRALEAIHRACTPRPDWEELHEAVAVTTAADQIGEPTQARPDRNHFGSRPSTRDRRGNGYKSGTSKGDDDDVDQRVNRILSSSWSTIDKVAALAQELSQLRIRNHPGDVLSSEESKLEQLQNEIQQTLEQLAAVRARSKPNA